MGKRQAHKTIEGVNKTLTQQLIRMYHNKIHMSIRLVEKKFIVTYHVNMERCEGFCMIYKVAGNGWGNMVTTSRPGSLKPFLKRGVKDAENNNCAVDT